MRQLFLAAFGVFAAAGVASAQQPPITSQPPIAAPTSTLPTFSPGAAPVATTGATVIRGTGCTNCGTAASTGTNFRTACSNVTGGNCMLGYPCQNGCGSCKSDLAFQYGTCKQFFSPCGPTCGHLFGAGGVLGGHCPAQPFAPAWALGWQCPRQYDSYVNH